MTSPATATPQQPKTLWWKHVSLFVFWCPIGIRSLSLISDLPDLELHLKRYNRSRDQSFHDHDCDCNFDRPIQCTKPLLRPLLLESLSFQTWNKVPPQKKQKSFIICQTNNPFSPPNGHFEPVEQKCKEDLLNFWPIAIPDKTKNQNCSQVLGKMSNKSPCKAHQTRCPA